MKKGPKTRGQPARVRVWATNSERERERGSEGRSRGSGGRRERSFFLCFCLFALSLSLTHALSSFHSILRDAVFSTIARRRRRCRRPRRVSCTFATSAVSGFAFLRLSPPPLRDFSLTPILSPSNCSHPSREFG